MVKSIFNGMGHRLSDNTASGGIRDENDLLGCSHCQKLMKRHLWADDGGFCHGCGRPVCGPCCDLIPRRGCTTFLKTLEISLEKAYQRAQNAKILGHDLTRQER